MSASRDAVKRYEIADYLNIATAEAGQESYELMGIGF